MRACVIAAAIVALAQPAFAAKPHKKNSHRHHASHLSQQHLVKHHRKHARLRRAPIESGYATPMFARTNATDAPTFSDPSFPNRAWSENQVASQTQFVDRAWTQPAQPLISQSVRLRTGTVRNTALDSMIARHAAANGLPADLVHRVVRRESNYNPRASSRGNIGLMQIRHATARGIGYTGSAAGLLDPEVNLTYAVKYLAGAYRAAGGNAGRAVAYYASGYHGRGVAVARRAPARTIVLSSRSAPGLGWQSTPVALGGM
jgi:soluble lytic murein transglycosylase-like protein